MYCLKVFTILSLVQGPALAAHPTHLAKKMLSASAVPSHGL